MSALDDRSGVVDKRAAKNDVGDWNQQGLFINGGQQTLQRHGDAVIGGHHMHARAAAALRLPEVHHRGKIHVGVNHFVAASAEVETRCYCCLALSYVLVQRNGIGGRIHERPNLIADFERHSPPRFLPGAHAASGPHLGVLAQGISDATRHRAQRIADEIGGLLQDGKFSPVAQQRVRHGEIVFRKRDFFMKR